MTPEQMVAVIQKLQSRVDALETRSRQDRADATAAKAELRAIRADRGVRRDRPISPTAASYAVVSAAAPVALISKGEPAIVPVAAPSGTFDGFYAAAFGGYRFATRKQPNFVGAPAYSTAVEGSNFGVAFGYNVSSGPILFGLEGRARKGFDEAIARGDTGAFGTTLPRFLYSGCCNPGAAPGVRPLRPGEISDFDLVYHFKTRQSMKREYGGDISARVGYVIGDSLLYFRLGAGADAIKYTNRVDRSGTVSCITPTGYVETTLSGYSAAYATGCTSIANGGISRTTTHGAQPYGLLGLGVEHNFGPYFVRAEGAVLNHFASGARFFSDTYYTTEVTGAVGVRF